MSTNEYKDDGTSIKPAFPTMAATKLRHIVEHPNAFLVCPGVHDGFSARIALQVGFDGLYMVLLPFISSS